MAANAPIKTYTLTNSGFWTQRHLQLHSSVENRTVLWVNTKSGFMSKPQVDLQTGSENGPIVAAAKMRSFSSGVRIYLGNPDTVAKEDWSDVDREGFSGKQYVFNHAGRRYYWRRTHKAAFGASSWGDQDFKLLDAANENNVLAVYVKDRQFFKASEVGKIDFYVELGRDLELVSLAAILGVEERIRRAKAASGGSGGGGGGA